jgi:hypothetical protein
MGQDCELLGEVCGWINAKATKPVWAKMTPNITDITAPAAVAAKQGGWGLGSGWARDMWSGWLQHSASLLSRTGSLRSLDAQHTQMH